MKRCKKCILPETIPFIKFDDEGVCNYCKYEANQPVLLPGKEKFDEFIDYYRQEKKRRNSRYHCIVPMSGGRDSSYVAWKMVREYGLDVLCVNYANPFTSEQAKINMKKLSEKLGVEIVQYRFRPGLHEAGFARNLEIWLRNPSLATVNMLCLPCKPFYWEIFRIARRNRVGLIIDGSNPYEVTSFKNDAVGGFGTKALYSRTAIMNFIKNVLKRSSYINPRNIESMLKVFLVMDGNTPFLHRFYSGIRKTALFYWIPYDEKEIERVLYGELGWEKSKDNESPWRFDCEIDSIKNLCFKRLIDATEKDDLFSRNIRAGLMARDEAMKRIEMEGKINLSIVDRVLSKAGKDRSIFGLSEQELYY